MQENMHGILIVSADPAVRQSLRLLLQEGSTVHERSTVSEALMIAAAQAMDYIFVDDMFADGTGMDMVRRLYDLGYSLQIIPMLLSDERIYAEPFKEYGVRYCITKPFDVERINEVVAHIAEVRETQRNASESGTVSSEPTAPAAVEAAANAVPAGAVGDQGETRELAQRLQRLLSRSLRRDELLRAFTECLQDQFDLDNVVLLLRDTSAPEFRIFSGDVAEEVREQFYIPLSDPLLATLMRMNETVAVDDKAKLGSQHVVAARRYAERMNIHLLCPVIARGELLALVGLSNSHRYGRGRSLNTLLRVFVSFFARALENAERYQYIYTSQQTYKALVETLPGGAVMISPDGTVRHVNAAACDILGINGEDFVGLQIEKIDSRLAGIVRTALATETVQGEHILEFAGGLLEVSSARTRLPDGNGIALFFRKSEEKQHSEQASVTAAPSTNGDMWRNMSRAIAHNFKNALVPVKTCAELLGERYEDQEFRDSFFRLTQDGINKVNRWVEELMYFSELNTGAGKMEGFLLKDAVANGVRKALEHCEDFEPDIQWDMDDGDHVIANQQHMERAFYELAANAFEAVRENAEPQVCITTRRSGRIIQVFFRDNGAGFAENEKIAAFKPFYSNRMSGLGLGLTLVETVVRAHGGNLEIVPAKENGACIQLSLPIISGADNDMESREYQRQQMAKN